MALFAVLVSLFITVKISTATDHGAFHGKKEINGENYLFSAS